MKGCILFFAILLLNGVIPSAFAMAVTLANDSLRHPKAPTQLGAILLLVFRWRERRGGRKCYFNASMDALAEKWRPNNHYPIILADNKPWSIKDMTDIRRTWTTLDFKFINIQRVWESVPTIPVAHLEDAKSPTSDLNYKRMCHFFMKGFTEVPVLMNYRYLLRLDDDTCLLDHINFDLFEYVSSHRAAYAYAHIVHDSKKVTNGLYAFVKAYVADNGLQYQNPTLYKAMVSRSWFSHGIVPVFNTNFEVINTVRYREPAAMHFVNAVVQSNMIFHRRWGDAPLRFALAMIVWTEWDLVRFESFGMQHSSWPGFNVSEASLSGNPPDLVRDVKR